MSDFLLELFSEEIPARMQAGARADLERLFRVQLDSAGLKAESIRTYSTPRRLALIATGLPEGTEAVREETKGPREGAPPQALEGFCRKLGLTPDDLEIRDGVYFAVVDKPGQQTASMLAPLVEAIIRDFPWPKSMRWGPRSIRTDSLKWVRPLHRIVAMLGEEIIPVAIDGVAVGAASLGHRFHHPGEITFGGAHDYVDKLRMAHVLVDHEERQDIVRKGAADAAARAGAALIEDEGLVIENAGLTEWPVPLLGSFDPDYLDVPEEVIQLTARLDQKYFVMRGADGRMAPNFVCTANIDSKDPAAVVAGNQRVLAARLSDARFFWQNDLKVPLDSLSPKLAQIVFHEKLGTVADKVDRVAKLARWLAEEKIVAADPDLAERAARLSKNDLVTGMVGEFPELQGIIGGHLARAQGEPDAVADAIRDHYKPVGQGDDVPTAPVTVAISLADKLDSLFAFFGEGMFPTGSKDPFALRRAGIGVLQLIRENELKFDLSVMAGDVFGAGQGSRGTVLADFLFERLAVLLKEEGVRHDFIQASRSWIHGSDTDCRLDRVSARASALTRLMASDDGANLHAAYKRAANILKKEGYEGEGAIPGTLVIDGEEDPLSLVDKGQGSAAAEMSDGDLEPAERALADALVRAAPLAQQSLEDEDFARAMEALASLRGPIDTFFDDVTVNADDPAVRQRRLALLARFRGAVRQVADFSKIEG